MQKDGGGGHGSDLRFGQGYGLRIRNNYLRNKSIYLNRTLAASLDLSKLP